MSNSIFYCSKCLRLTLLIFVTEFFAFRHPGRRQLPARIWLEMCCTGGTFCGRIWTSLTVLWSLIYVCAGAVQIVTGIFLIISLPEHALCSNVWAGAWVSKNNRIQYAISNVRVIGRK